MNSYEKVIDDFKTIRQSLGMSSQDIAGPKNCQIYSFERQNRIVRLDTFITWLEKMGHKIQIVKETKQK